jgi:hypothetical protein
MTELKKLLNSYDICMDGATVHAVAGHVSGGDIHLIHWRINNFKDLVTLADQCKNSQIRIILIWDNETTQAVDVWPGEITGD